MVYLCINLPAFRQLNKLQKDVLQKARDAVTAFIDTTGCELVFNDDGTWIAKTALYGSAGELRRKKIDFASAVIDLREKLSRHERHLQGYNLLIDTGDEELNGALLGTLKTRLFSGSEASDLLITAEATELFEDLFETSSETGEILSILKLKTERLKTGPPVAGFLVREDFLADFTGVFESMCLGEHEARTIVLLAGSGGGGTDTAEHALDVQFSGTDARWITIRESDGRFGYASPVAHSVMNTLELFAVPDYLGKMERDLWERRMRSLFEQPDIERCVFVSDRPEVDLFQIVFLQLSAYQRWMEGQLLPPTWLCEGYDRLATSVKRACMRAVKNLSPGNFISIFIVHDETVPEELSDVPYVVLRVPAIEKPEIVTKIVSFASQSSDGPAETADELANRFLSAGVRSLRDLYRMYRLSRRRQAADRYLQDPLCALLSGLDVDIQRSLLLMIEGGLVLQERYLAAYFKKCNLSPESLQSAETAAEDLKLDIYGNQAEALSAADCLRNALDTDRTHSLGALVQFLAEDMAGSGSARNPASIEAAGAAGERAVSVRLLNDYIDKLLESGDFTAAAETLNSVGYLKQDRETSTVLEVLALRTSSLAGNTRQALGSLSELRRLGETRNDEIEGRKLLEYARYHYAAGSFQEGLQDSKNALISFQKCDAGHDSEAYLYIGLHMLAQSRVDEAEAYMQIARESTSKDNATLFILTGLYSAVTDFMIGNLTKAVAAISEARERADECALHRYQLYLVFFEVRLQFELGRYERCIEHCLTGLTLCRLYGDEGPRQVFERWLRRSEAFCGMPLKAAVALEKIATNTEGRLFLAESLYLADRTGQAIQCLESPGFELSNEMNRFTPAEQMLWETGFSNVEDRAITGVEKGGVLPMLERAFYAYLQSQRESVEQGLNTLARITREERLSEIDPYNGSYFYFHACAIGAASGEKNLDRLTALSKAFKYIQERAAMMDDSADKQSYLRENYFNSKILESARESNLM